MEQTLNHLEQFASEGKTYCSGHDYIIISNPHTSDLVIRCLMLSLSKKGENFNYNWKYDHILCFTDVL